MSNDIVTQDFITAQYELIDKAIELFEGDRLKASLWLSSPKPALGGEKPLDSPFEAIDLVGRLKHGVF